MESSNHVNGYTQKSQTLTIVPGKLSLSDLRTIYSSPVKIILDQSAYGPIKESADCVDQIVKEKITTYGINTGIGLLASTLIGQDELEKFQRALITSHAAGIGAATEDNLVRLIMVLKINSLSRGFSGIRQEVIDALIALVNAQIYPHIPLKGSVGASGDLAPLAHMSLVLIGEGKAHYNEEWISANEALSHIGLKPLILAPKEGLALINGAQVSTAFALRGLFSAEELYANATVCGSLTLEAVLGSRRPFDARIHSIRGHQAQIDAAAAYRHLLGDRTEISDFHMNCKNVQDPYSLRCQPQVMGACLTQIRNAAKTLLIEANAVSDNPLIFFGKSTRDVISGGNFHAEPIAMVADNLALALAEIGSLSERRVALLMDKHISQLPGFLTKSGGLYSGFMAAQISTAALASENKALAHPHCIDSIPTSGNQEDHVSMAPAASRRLWAMADNVRGIVAVEWLAACQGLDMRAGLLSSPHLERARHLLRKHVSFYEDDRFFAPDIEVALKLLESGCLISLVPSGLLPSRS